MKVRKFKNTVHIKLDKDEIDDYESIYYNEELFWNDLYIESSDGWLYLHDTNRNEVCFITGYHYNLLDELIEGGTVIFHYRPNDPDYEFNQD